MNTIIRGLLYSLVVLAFIDGSPAVFSSVAQSAPASGAAGAVSRQPPRDAARPVATARILGRVVAADTGQPLRKAQVRIAANDAKVNRTTTTDAQGRYEFKELPAGRYTVAATKGSFVTAIYGQRRPFEPGKPVDVSAGQAFDKIDLALSRGAVITGQVVDEFGEPIPDVQVIPMRSQYLRGRRQLTPAGRAAITNDLGEFRAFGLAPGEYYVTASQRNASTPESDDRTGYAPTYYPGTGAVGEAQRITVGPAQVVMGINLGLVPVRTAKLSGNVRDSEGRALAGAAVHVVQRAGTMSLAGGDAIADSEGVFNISGVAPGEYLLWATGPPTPGRAAELAAARVNVSGEDVTGIVVSAPRLGVARGRINFIGTNPPPNTAVRLAAASLDPDLPADNTTFSVNDDSTFELRVRPGLSIVRGPVAAAGWIMKAVRLNGHDVTDAGIDVKPGESLNGLEVDFTNVPSQLAGSVADSGGHQVRDYAVIVFAQDRARWGYLSRYLRIATPDQDGQFKVTSLPAGDYYVVALDAAEPTDVVDPAFLERLQPHAATFSLQDGEHKQLTVAITPVSVPAAQ